MAIVNLTPDSFFEGSRFTDFDALINRVDQHLNEGADFIDLGAQSTRPGADWLDEHTEWKRLELPLKEIRRTFPQANISIDTFHSIVASQAIDCGADLINDVSGGDFDPHMFATIKRYQVPYIFMHTSGKPKEMQAKTDYTNVVEDVLYALSEKKSRLNELGINDCIADPGFGFGKTLNQNYELLYNLHVFKQLKVPILAGLSRKSMVNKVLNCTADEALNGTTVLNTIALLNGVSILRVHDTKEAKEAVKLTEQFLALG